MGNWITAEVKGLHGDLSFSEKKCDGSPCFLKGLKVRNEFKIKEKSNMHILKLHSIYPVFRF